MSRFIDLNFIYDDGQLRELINIDSVVSAILIKQGEYNGKTALTRLAIWKGKPKKVTSIADVLYDDIKELLAPEFIELTAPNDEKWLLNKNNILAAEMIQGGLFKGKTVILCKLAMSPSKNSCVCQVINEDFSTVKNLLKKE